MGAVLTQRIRNVCFIAPARQFRQTYSRFGNAVGMAWRVARVTNWDPPAWVGHYVDRSPAARGGTVGSAI